MKRIQNEILCRNVSYIISYKTVMQRFMKTLCTIFVKIIVRVCFVAKITVRGIIVLGFFELEFYELISAFCNMPN